MKLIQVCAKADVSGRVEELGSSIFLTDLTGWVPIDEGEGDRYAHAQGNYLEKPLMDACLLYPSAPHSLTSQLL